MNDMKFMDAWLYRDELDVLDAFDDLLDGLGTGPIEYGTEVDGNTVLGGLDSIRNQGWLEIGYDPDVAPVLFAEALKRLHRREIPLALPLTEVWLAARLLSGLSAANPDAGPLLAGLGEGEYLSLAIDDLFTPPAPGPLTTGWIPFADSMPVLLPIRAASGVHFVVVPPSIGDRIPGVGLDPSVSVSRIVLPDVDGLDVVGELSGPDLDNFRGQALLAQSSAMVGQAQSMLAATINYARVREQFGVPIGSFQAVKHRCADLVADLHVANLISGYVASLSGGGADLAPLGYLAKAFCGRVAMNVASEAIQLHGGMGFTWECNMHLGLKRCAYIAMAGMSVGSCETQLAQWAVSAEQLVWPAGVDG